MSRKIENKFRYSYSRNGTRRDCLRKYYYSYYMHWEGWLVREKLADVLHDRNYSHEIQKKIAYTFKKSATKYTFIGNFLHEAIENTLFDLEKGKVITNCKEYVADQIYKFERQLGEAVDDQLSNGFLDKPKDHLFFVEYLNSPSFRYGPKKAKEVSWEWFKADAIKLFRLNLVNYFLSGLYESLVKFREECDIFEIEKEIYVDFTFNSNHGDETVRLSVKPDLFTVTKDGTLSIFDWKTGSLKNIKMDQLDYYGYIFSKLIQTDPQYSNVNRIMEKVYCLKESAPITKEFDPHEPHESTLTSHLRMMSLLTDTGLEENKVSHDNIDRFEQKVNKGLFGCRACPFLLMCPGTMEKLKLD